MVDDLPTGPFDVVFVAYNTFFNLLTAERQAACFAAVAARLAPGGSFVVEAFVPEDPPRRGDVVDVRSMTADEVVLSVTATTRRAAGRGPLRRAHRGEPVRLRPWSIRYCTPAELDAMAAAAGLVADRPLGGRGRRAVRSRQRRATSACTRWRTGHDHRHGPNATGPLARGRILGSDMSQMRLNPLTGRWVTIVAERAERPTDFAPRTCQVETDPDRPCPFCPGHEEATPPALETVDAGGHWRMRVVPNLYPAFDGDDAFVVHHLGPGARGRRGQRHPRGLRLHPRPRRRPRPASTTTTPPS